MSALPGVTRHAAHGSREVSEETMLIPLRRGTRWLGKPIHIP